MATKTELCSPCYWGECLEKQLVCAGKCICRCQPRRPVSDSTNKYVREGLSRELRAHAYAHQGVLNTFQLEGLYMAARLIEEGMV